MKGLLARLRDFLAQPTLEAIRNAPQGPDAAAQLQLMLAYRRLAEEKHLLPRISEIGFKCHSQADEDGILLFLFSIIGVATKLSVEICAGDGIECNTANLILNHGWHGLRSWRQGERRAQHALLRAVDAHLRHPPRFCLLVGDETLDQRHSGEQWLHGRDRLLSLDLDGHRYWIWDSITAVTPRVVVVEYQDILGPARSWAIRTPTTSPRGTTHDERHAELRRGVTLRVRQDGPPKRLPARRRNRLRLQCFLRPERTR